MCTHGIHAPHLHTVCLQVSTLFQCKVCSHQFLTMVQMYVHDVCVCSGTMCNEFKSALQYQEVQYIQGCKSVSCACTGHHPNQWHEEGLTQLCVLSCADALHPSLQGSHPLQAEGFRGAPGFNPCNSFFECQQSWIEDLDSAHSAAVIVPHAP